MAFLLLYTLLEAAGSTGATPVQMAAQRGYSEFVSVLVEAGANTNSHFSDGATPLIMVAQDGHIDAVKVLLRAKADPLLASTQGRWKAVPLDAAAENGHSDVARELIQQCGIDGCGGDTRGVSALKLAAQQQHLDFMALPGAGVVDTGAALINAVKYGCEASVRFLLQRGFPTTSDGGASMRGRTRQ